MFRWSIFISELEEHKVYVYIQKQNDSNQITEHEEKCRSDIFFTIVNELEILFLQP